MSGKCPFCEEQADYYLRRGSAAALWDNYPVNPGHTLVVPVAHRENLLACTPEEIGDLWTVVQEVVIRLQDSYRPDGFNIGTNVGRAAGQTVFHCHIHVIPRFDGDSEAPRGGVRKVKDPLVSY
jgi:diadenosine tetraphosphate (Ap4A) HIT family hydrolase